MRLVPPKAGSTHEEILRNVVKPTGGNSERRSLNGLSATHFSGTVQGEQGQSGKKTVSFPRGGFMELAKSSSLLTRPEAQLRLINGAFGGGVEPKAGQVVG